MISISPRSRAASSARPGFVVELDRFLALLDELLQQAEDLLVGQHRLAAALRLEVGVLQCGIDQPQRRHTALIAGFHRLLEGGVDLVAQHGYGLSQIAPESGSSRRARERRRAEHLGFR